MSCQPSACSASWRFVPSRRYPAAWATRHEGVILDSVHEFEPMKPARERPIAHRAKRAGRGPLSSCVGKDPVGHLAQRLVKVDPFEPDTTEDPRTISDRPPSARLLLPTLAP